MEYGLENNLKREMLLPHFIFIFLKCFLAQKKGGNILILCDEKTRSN